MAGLLCRTWCAFGATAMSLSFRPQRISPKASIKWSSRLFSLGVPLSQAKYAHRWSSSVLVRWRSKSTISMDTWQRSSDWLKIAATTHDCRSRHRLSSGRFSTLATHLVPALSMSCGPSPLDEPSLQSAILRPSNGDAVAPASLWCSFPLAPDVDHNSGGVAVIPTPRANP
jgi:hypothetical protein